MRKYMSVFLTLNSLLLTLNSAVQGDLFKTGICDGWDDAYQAGNSINNSAGYIRTGYHATYGYYYSGFRFQNVTINNGATIDSAFLEMYGGPDIVSNVTSTIYGHKVNNSPNFAYSNDSLHERDSTNANVFWTYDITNGEWNKTIDIKSIISEITNREGWSSGNALSIILHTTDAPEEDKKGYWRSYEWSPDSVCTLSVYWTEGSGPDTTPPAPPESLTANGSHPSPWTNDSMFVIDWTNPYDESGIVKAFYKLGSSPNSNYDTTGSLSGIPPDTVFSTTEGEIWLYVWLEDGAGNVDYNNKSMVYLRYDATPPAPFSLISPPDSAYIDTTRPTFTWQASFDNLSGLKYYKIYVDGGWYDTIPDTSWTMNYDLSEGPHPWYIKAYDNAGNWRQSYQTWTVIIDTTTAPLPPTSLVATAWGLGQIDLSWIDNSTNEDGFEIVRKDSVAGTYAIIDSVGANIMVYSDTGLENEHEYWYKVRAYNIYGYSNYTNVDNAITPPAEDTTAPGPPISLIANGSNPSPWTNDSMFVIDWTNPYDESGIVKAFYKLGSSPNSNYDTTGSLSGIPPDTVFSTTEGEIWLYVWLEDGAGNKDHNNRDSVNLRYDKTNPTGSVASSPDTTNTVSFTVSWIPGSDAAGPPGSGSGLTGGYDVKVKIDEGGWSDWKTNYYGLSDTYTGSDGHTYYFEASARDSAGNIEEFTGVPECSTFVDVSGGGITAWEVAITTTFDGSDLSTVTFATDSNATDGFDEGLDQESPPAPPSGLYTYFSITGHKLIKDARDAKDSPIVWKFKIIDPDDKSDTVRWSPSDLPADGAFMFDTAGLKLDMKEESLAVYTGFKTVYIKYTYIPSEDTTAPGPPISLTANGSNPSPWTNDSLFVLSWTNPTDPSNIAKALYKLGTAPDSNYDTTGSLSLFPPDSVSITQESINSLYLWLVDGTGNVDYNNNASVDLRYDITSPDSFSLISPPDSAIVDTTRPTLIWQSSSDGMSGLKFYKINIDGLFRDTVFDTTWTANYDLTEGGHLWYIVTYDSAGNWQQSIQTWTIIIDTTVYAPDIDISYFSHNFGDVAIGDSSDWIFKIYNVGNDTLIVDSCQLTVDSEFLVVSPSFPQPVPPYFPDSFSLDVTIRFKPMVTGIVEDTLNIHSNDPDESILQISLTGTGIGVDTTAPSAPLNLTANGSSPSLWTNDSMFVINWINPETDVAKALYKIGLPPTNNSDTTGTLSGTPPDTVYTTTENGVMLYLWLADSSLNTDYHNSAFVRLQYDATPPINCIASSPDTSTDSTFIVSWTTGIDSVSGISGKYDVKVLDVALKNVVATRLVLGKIRRGINPRSTGLWEVSPDADNQGQETFSTIQTWYPWLTDYAGNSATYIGEPGHIYYFEASARDIAGNIEIFTEVAECSTIVDTTALDNTPPSPPESLLANGSNPSPWTNDSLFVISWISPYDPSGVSKTLYKLGSAPDSDYDTTGSLSPIPPVSVSCTQEGSVPLYVWLVDGANNVDYQNRAGVILRYDAVQPMGSEAGSPVVSKKTNFTVQWSSGTDIGGSGLSGRYSVKVKYGISPWYDLLTDTLLTQITFTGEHGDTCYFEAVCHDNAGNIESFREIAECSTFIDTTSPDTSAPAPPTGVTATGEDRSITILWSPNTEQDLAGYNVYRSAMSDGEYSAVNSHLIVGNWFRDEGLSGDTTSYYVVTAVDNDNNESGYSAPDSATTENTSPAPVSEFRALILEGARIGLNWARSSSYDIYQYNIYWDDGTGVINYDLPIDVVYHPSVVWVSGSLTQGQEYKFGLRAEDDAGNEERNTYVVVTVTPEGSTEGLVKVQILTPHAGKKIWGRRVTVLAKVVLGDQSEVKCVRFQYKPTFGDEWTDIPPAIARFPNPDFTHPYFVHWDVTVLDSGYYDIMSIATDTAGHPDPNPSHITVKIDPSHWDEEEGGGDKVSEHWKRERVERMCGNQSTFGSGDGNTVTRVIIPIGALEQNTELMTTIRDESNIPDIGDYKSTNEFREVWLENGQEILLSEKEFQIETPYLDEDNDGIVDDTDVQEGDIWLAYYNEIAGKWDSLDFYIDTENNLVFGSNYHMGIYALLGPKITGVQETEEDALRFTPYVLRLYQNFPNPFTAVTSVKWSGISEGQKISLNIYDLSGRLVKTLTTNPSSLTTAVSWDGTDDNGRRVPSGIYFYQLQAVDKKITKKMVILR